MVGEKEKGVNLMGSSRKRQRFYIELNTEETTIVSWKKLVRDAEKKDSYQSCLQSSSSPARKALDYLSFQDDKTDADQHGDASFRSGRCKNLVASSKNKQLSKTKAGMPKIKGDFVGNLTAKCDKTRVGTMEVKPEIVDSDLLAETGKLMAEMTENKRKSFDEAEMADFKRKSFDDPFSARNVTSEDFKNIASEALFDTSTSDMVLDRKLQALPDVPVLMYSKKSARNRNKSNCPPILNANGDTSVFPLKTKDFLQQKSTKVSPEKSRIKLEVASDSLLDNVHLNRCVALRMNAQSMNLMDGKKTEVHSAVQNDHLVGPTREAKVRRNADPVPHPMSKSIDPRILAQSSHPPVKRIKFNFSAERNMSTTGTQSYPKDQKMEVSEKKTVKVRFLLKQEHEDKKALKHPRPAAPLMCKLPT